METPFLHLFMPVILAFKKWRQKKKKFKVTLCHSETQMTVCNLTLAPKVGRQPYETHPSTEYYLQAGNVRIERSQSLGKSSHTSGISRKGTPACFLKSLLPVAQLLQQKLL